MNEVKSKLNEDVNDPGMVSAMEQQPPVQPMTDVNTPVAPAVEATPDEVANAQAQAQGNVQPVDPNAQEELNAAADNTGNKIINVTGTINKSDGTSETFTATADTKEPVEVAMGSGDAEAVQANQATELMQNPNVTDTTTDLKTIGEPVDPNASEGTPHGDPNALVEEQPLDQMTQSVGTKENKIEEEVKITGMSDTGDGEEVKQDIKISDLGPTSYEPANYDPLNPSRCSKAFIEKNIRESVILDFLRDIAQSVKDADRALGKDDDNIQGDLDTKLNLITKNPMFSDVEITDEIKGIFTLESKKAGECPEGECCEGEECKEECSGEECEKAEDGTVTSAIAQSKKPEELVTKEETEETPEPSKVEVKVEEEPATEEVEKEEDDMKLTDEEKEMIRQFRNYKADKMKESEETTGENFVDDVANVDMDTEDVSVDALPTPEEVAVGGDPVEVAAGEEDPVTGSESIEDISEDKSSEELMAELDKVLTDIYEGPNTPEYNMNLNINTNDKAEAIEGIAKGLEDIATFVNGVLKDETPVENEEVAETEVEDVEGVDAEEPVEEDTVEEDVVDAPEADEVKDEADDDLEITDEKVLESLRRAFELHEECEKVYATAKEENTYGESHVTPTYDDVDKNTTDVPSVVTKNPAGSNTDPTKALTESEEFDVPEGLEIKKGFMGRRIVYYFGEPVGELGDGEAIFNYNDETPEVVKEYFFDNDYILKLHESEAKKSETPIAEAINESVNTRIGEIEGNSDDLIAEFESKLNERRKSIKELRGSYTPSKFNEALKQMPVQNSAPANLNASAWSSNQFISHYKESKALNFKDLLKNGLLG